MSSFMFTPKGDFPQRKGVVGLFSPAAQAAPALASPNSRSEAPGFSPSIFGIVFTTPGGKRSRKKTKDVSMQGSL